MKRNWKDAHLILQEHRKLLKVRAMQAELRSAMWKNIGATQKTQFSIQISPKLLGTVGKA